MRSRVRIVIAGAGIAGMEALLALRDLMGERADIAVIDPDPVFRYRPWMVIEPFGGFSAPGWRRDELVPRLGGAFLCDSVTHVDAAARTVTLHARGPLRYDVLVLCPGPRR